MERSRALAWSEARPFWSAKAWLPRLATIRVDVPAWIMLAALCAVAAMSQAFRTVATVVAGELQRDLGASAQQPGLSAAAFHLSFAAAQIPIGVALDLYGPRR